jgi:cobalt-zinc-cadmium efflux system outer membrane protein
MRSTPAAAFLATALLELAAGCASTSAAPGFGQMSAIVEQRTGHKPHWTGKDPDAKATERAVQTLTRGPLSADAAVEVALLSSPALQAVYEDLSLAQADVVQAGLLSNPVLSADVTTAERDAISPNLIVGITQSFLDLLLIPAKRKVASAQFEAAKYRVGCAVLDTAAAVKSAFFAAVSAEQKLSVRRTMADAEEAASELAKRQAEAGNVSELAAAGERALYLETRLLVSRAEVEVAGARERLARLMGRPDVSWQTSARLPDLPGADPPVASLEDGALRGGANDRGPV